MEPLSKSDKIHLTAGQTSALAAFYNQCINSLASSLEVAFAPTQEWIDKFARIDYFFYASGETPEGRLLYNIRQGKISEGKEPWELRTEEPAMPEDSSPWVPQNGEEIEAEIVTKGIEIDWYPCFYIGKDFTNGEVVRLIGVNTYHCADKIRPKPKKTQVPLAELLSVYASVKGLTQDGVELKPEN